MTTFEKIGIQGVRSYGEDRVETIKFENPVTVIYGNNGTGKSTIIECLKISCTGEFPPNGDRGKSFIHDPIVSKKMNIKGKIDLMIKRYNNKRFGVSRSYSLCYTKDKSKNVKHSFKSLDNLIILKKENKDTIISSKCVDVNSQIPKLMGVSKALLENVILCHHEESLWPFSDSAKVKKKFDELFGDEHFSKILLDLQKSKKLMCDILKEKENELIVLKDSYMKRNNLTNEIERNEKEIEITINSINENKEKRRDIEEKVEQLKKQWENLRNIKEQVRMYFVTYEMLKRELEPFYNVEEIYKESLNELINFEEVIQNDLCSCLGLIEKGKKDIIDINKKLEMRYQIYQKKEENPNGTILAKNVNLLKKEKEEIIQIFVKAMQIQFQYIHSWKEKGLKEIVQKKLNDFLRLLQDHSFFFKSVDIINRILLNKGFFMKWKNNWKQDITLYINEDVSVNINEDVSVNINEDVGTNINKDVTDIMKKVMNEVVNTNDILKEAITKTISKTNSKTKIDLLLQYLRNHIKKGRKSFIFLESVFEKTKELKKEHKKGLLRIRTYIKYNRTAFLKNNLKKKNILKENRVLKKRMQKIETKIRKVEILKTQLSNLKKDEKEYENQMTKLEEMKRLQCFYNNMHFLEMKDINLDIDRDIDLNLDPNTVHNGRHENEMRIYEKSEKYEKVENSDIYDSNEINKISAVNIIDKVKEMLQQLFPIIHNCQLFFDNFLKLKNIRNNIQPYFIKMRNLFEKLYNHKCENIQKIIKEDPFLNSHVKSFLWNFHFNTFLNKHEHCNNNNENSNIDKDDNNDTFKEHGIFNKMCDYEYNSDDEIKNENVTMVEIMDSTKGKEGSETYKSQPINCSDKEDSIKGKKKKRTENLIVTTTYSKSKYPTQERIVKKRKLTNTILYHNDVINQLKVLIENEIHIYENKIETLKDERNNLEKEIIYSFKEICDLEKDIEIETTNMEKFHILLKEKNFKTEKEFVQCYDNIIRDIYTGELEMYSLQEKEKFWDSYLNELINKHLCDFCKKELTDIEVDHVKQSTETKKKELNEKKNIHSTKITSLKNKKLELCSLLYYHQKNRNMMMEKNTDIIENEESTENVKDMKYMKNIKDIVHDVVHDENINKIKLMKETVDKKKIKVENCKKKLENISKQEIDIYEKEKVIKECLKDVVSLINKQNDIFEEQKRMNIYFKEMVIVNEDMKKLNHFYLFQSLIDNLLNTVKEKQWDRKLIKEFINFLDMCQKNNPTFLIKQILDFFLFSLEKSLQQTTSTFSSYNNKCSENMQMNSSTQFIKKNVSADFVQKNNDEMLGKKKETMERTAEMTSTGSRLGSGSTLRLRSRSESGLELNNKADSFFSSDDDMDFVKGNKRDHFFFPTNQNDQRKLSTKGKVQLLSSYNLENERKYKEKYVEELLNENNFPHKIDQINMNTLEKERKLEKKYECEKVSFDVYRFLSDEKSFFSSEKIDNTILFVGDFSKIYNNLLSILYIEENKKKEEMKTIYYVKDFFNKKKHSVCDKIKDFENSIKMEKNIRESLDSVNADLLQMFERKKRKIENKIVRNEIFIKKCELIQRKLKRRIIKNKYCFFWENKNYYILIHMLKDLILKMTQVNKEVTLEEGALLKMENERSYNEALKNEIEELNKSINKKKEDILCLEEEKVKLEQMKHSIIINQNLKKLHERFLAHHKEVINFLKKIKDNVFSIDINNNNIHNDRDRDMYMDRDRDRDRDKDTIKTLELIITEYENILEQNYDIHSFVEESFNFLNEKTKINICLFETEEKLAKEIEMCCDRMNELKMKEAEYNGQLVLRNEYIDRYKKEINSKYYINIENEYKKKIVETYVYKNVIKDILIFYKAFDEAIIKFHSLKMQEINTSIKNLWRRVYNSSDIDYIYIKSDIQSTTNDKFVIRKSYNYRVVMVKDKCELDMKGRCSSGQKVLSSIIIRLALAESFSIRCGILALDEPTTNLDKKNSKNLASLIANIVELRKETSTFQLILITHDTYFVNMLTQHGLTNCFYQVSRDENGYSTIKQLRS